MYIFFLIGGLWCIYCLRIWARYNTTQLKKTLAEFKIHVKNTIKDRVNDVVQCLEPYDKKYSRKLLEFPDMYYFTESELEEEQTKLSELRRRNDVIKSMIEQNKEILARIETIYKENIEDKIYIMMLVYFGYISQEEVDTNDYSLDNFNNLDKSSLKKNLNADMEKYEGENLKLVSNYIGDDMMIQLQARTHTVDLKLSKYVNNYVVENTPLGEVWMRYNHSRGTFEYFSNHSIPYRFLEVVCRKYVMTYWCKPLYVNVDVELEKAKDKSKDVKDKDKDVKDKKEKDKSNYSTIRSYNEAIKTKTSLNKKSNSILPPQLMNRVKTVDTNREKTILVKENANRYTWQGRLSDFDPLKRIKRSDVDKNAKMSFLDYKNLKIK